MEANESTFPMYYICLNAWAIPKLYKVKTNKGLSPSLVS